MKLVYVSDEKVVRFREDEAIVQRSVNEDAVDAWRAEVARGVELAILPRGEDGVLEAVRHGVDHCRGPVAEALVHGPHLDALRYLLVRAQRVGGLPAVALGDVACGVNLVELAVVNLGLGTRDAKEDY